MVLSSGIWRWSFLAVHLYIPASSAEARVIVYLAPWIDGSRSPKARPWGQSYFINIHVTWKRLHNNVACTETAYFRQVLFKILLRVLESVKVLFGRSLKPNICIFLCTLSLPSWSWWIKALYSKLSKFINRSWREWPRVSPFWVVHKWWINAEGNLLDSFDITPKF